MKEITSNISQWDNPTALICNGHSHCPSDTYTVVDPGFRPIAPIYEFLKEKHGILHGIIVTHGHTDHTNNLSRYTKKTQPLTVIAHKKSYLYLLALYALKKEKAKKEGRRYFIDDPSLRKHLGNVFIPVEEPDCIKIGERVYRFFHTPGHTPGENILSPGEDISILVDRVLFTGDLLCHFSFIPQLCDFHYISSLEKLVKIEDYDWVCPGHGRPMRKTSAKRMMKILLDMARQMERIAREMAKENIQHLGEQEDKLWNYPLEIYKDFLTRLSQAVPLFQELSSEPESLAKALKSSMCRIQYALNYAEAMV